MNDGDRPAQPLGYLRGQAAHLNAHEGALNTLVLGVTVGSLESIRQSYNRWLVAREQILYA